MALAELLCLALALRLRAVADALIALHETRVNHALL